MKISIKEFEIQIDGIVNDFVEHISTEEEFKANITELLLQTIIANEENK